MSSSTTTRYAVSGMTCGHCVAAVRDELTQLPGVSSVEVALVPEAASTVTVISDAPLRDQQVATALSEAGAYHLTTN